MTLAVPYFICRCCKQCPSARYRHRAFSTTPYTWSQARNSSYYDLLGIKKDATQEEIKRAFFCKSKKLHPDSNPRDPDLHNQFVKLNEAYTVLSKESSRRQYDSMRAARAAWGPPPGYGRSPDFQTRSKTGPGKEKDFDEWAQQFYYRDPFSAEEAERRRQGNHKLVQYILMMMMGVALIQFIAYRQFSEISARKVAEKNEQLTRIYNESKERARAKRKKRQQLELLYQKQNEFVQRYYTRCKRFAAAPGRFGSVTDPAASIPTAK
nr:dnaJ homolog subfamily C member 4 [Pogona vitticeps]XP_020657430.1 dnaJ homolog subfamily C member 4 [Pogona vitticeps]